MKTQATLDDLVNQVGSLTTATTDLLNATADGKLKLDEAVTNAETSASTATSEANRADSQADRSKTEADRAEAARTGAETAEANAEKAAADAAAIAYEGAASLEPAPGNLAIADSTGTFATGWIKPVAIPEPDFHLPLVNDLHVKSGLGMPVTFTRDTKGTCLDKFTGQVTEIDKDQPRFENNGVLIEGSGTNFFLHSAFTANVPNWYFYGNSSGLIKGQPSVTGENTALKWGAADGRITGHLGHVSIAPPKLNSYYTWSFVYKTGSLHNLVRLNIAGGNETESNKNASFHFYTDDRSIKVNSITDGSFQFKDLGDGWVRLSVSFKNFLDTTAHGNKLYWFWQDAGTLLEPLFLDCWQLEQSPTPTSYIPTTGTAVTRTPDNLQLDESIVMPATHSEATIVFEMDFQNTKGWQSFITSADCFSYGQYGGQGSITVYKAAKYPFSSVGINDDQAFIYCIRKYKDRYQMLVNGELKGEVPVSEYTSTERGTTLLGINRINGDRPIFGHIRNLRIWNHALTDHQIYHLGGTD